MHASVQCEDRSRQAGLGDALADLEQDGRLPGVELGEAVVLASGLGAAMSDCSKERHAQFLGVALVLGRSELGQELVLARRLEALVARDEAIDRSPRGDSVLRGQ